MHYVGIVIALPCPHVTFAVLFLKTAVIRKGIRGWSYFLSLARTLISYVLLPSVMRLVKRTKELVPHNLASQSKFNNIE